MVEVVNNYKQYIDQAVEYGMKAIGFSEHGNVLSWYNKKMYAEQNGLKYIHGTEAYITMTLEEKKRDNYHMILIAKNFDGFKELNKLISTGFDRKTNNFYFNPRISWDDIKNTSDNIIITTACLGGVIWQLHKQSEKDKSARDKLDEVIDWMASNKHRVFLEVQPHYMVDQIIYNKMLKALAKDTGMMLIAGSDTHALNDEYDKARKIMQKAKHIKFTDEDKLDLGFHSYEKIFGMFQKQGIFTDKQIEEVLENTNVLADMVETWEVDRSKKYPQLYENPEQVFKEKIAEGIKIRGIDKLPIEERKKYAERIAHEYEVYKANDAINYMLLEYDVKSYARSKGVRYGFGRGSVSGSIIAYLLQITHMDSIKRNLNFARFMSKERVSLADIDTDFEPSKRHIIQDYLLNHPKLYCAHIVTYNTIALKGAIRDVGRGLGMPLAVVDEIAKGVDENEDYYREKYPELFHYVDLVQGVVTSIGAHACGIAVSPIPLDEHMGLITTIDQETKQPVTLTQINMKEIDAQNFVKLDVLGLDTIEVLSNTVDYAGLKWEDIFPENLDANDEKVWDSVMESNVGIFQYESDFAHQIFKDLFSKETIEKIRKRNPNFSYIDLFSLGNAILRPSGASYRESVVRGEFYDNGHTALNEFLKPTLGRLVYQEQIIEFLVKFCGYTYGEADVVRRAIGKKQKETLDKLLPEIEQRFIETMINKYGVSKDEAIKISKPFMQVIMDASDYGFSINHSDAYSWLGYACAWARYYYPLEFITANLNANIGKQEKTAKLVEYAKSKGIDIKGIKFRYSKAGYMFDRETNAIYQGIEPIKYLNAQVAEGLYKLRNRKYDSFTDLLVDIKDGGMLSYLKHYDEETLQTMEKYGELIPIEDTTVPINAKQMKILICLNFFDEFGGNKKLLNIYEFFDKIYKKNLKIKSKKERYEKVLQYERELQDETLSLIEQCEKELEYLGHIETHKESIPKNMLFITEVNKYKSYVRGRGYQFATGETIPFKISSKVYSYVPFKEKDVIKIAHAELKPKKKKVDGRWVNSNENELWLKTITFVRKGNDSDD